MIVKNIGDTLNTVEMVGTNGNYEEDNEGKLTLYALQVAIIYASNDGKWRAALNV